MEVTQYGLSKEITRKIVQSFHDQNGLKTTMKNPAPQFCKLQQQADKNKDATYGATYSIEFVLSLHVMLNEHNIVDSFLQLERIFLLGSDIA